MARTTKTNISEDEKPLPILVVPLAEAKEKITKQVSEGKKIQNLAILDEKELQEAESLETKWTNITINLLKSLFKTSSLGVEYELKARKIGFGGRLPIKDEARYFALFMNTKIVELESILESLEMFPVVLTTNESQSNTRKSLLNSTNVFIVHGHDSEAKESVSRFIHKIGLQPIILNEQPNEGLTIIEKFEQASNRVGYAVVLLTPDDVGGPKGKMDNLQPRARQNVIFELGYFAAKLGRQRVCALYKGNVEIPSDYHGVTYVSMDKEDWQVNLAKDIKKVVLIDMNKVFE